MQLTYEFTFWILPCPGSILLTSSRIHSNQYEEIITTVTHKNKSTIFATHITHLHTSHTLTHTPTCYHSFESSQ